MLANTHAGRESINEIKTKRPFQELTLITESTREAFFRTEIPFGPLIYAEAVKNDLRPELVAAVVQTESQFKPTARSQANAQGLMQLMPRTGKWMGADNLMNPIENVQAGTKYLKYLTERFDGDETKIIAAYNAGEGNVRKFGGVPPLQGNSELSQEGPQIGSGLYTAGFRSGQRASRSSRRISANLALMRPASLRHFPPSIFPTRGWPESPSVS